MNVAVTKQDLENLKAELLAELKVMLNIQVKAPEKKWLKGREMMELLKCSDSKLQSLRVRNKIDFKKVGGTYYYLVD
jgi:hypothetical protein